MKKLKKLSLKQMEGEMAMIGSDEQRFFVGGSGVVYSFSDYEQMVANGTWTGGEVEGMGYIGYTASDVKVYSGSGAYYTGSELIDNMTNEGLNQIASIIWGEVPMLGSYVSFLSDEMATRNGDFANVLWSNGYSNDAICYVRETNNGDEVSYELIDYETGAIVASCIMNETGWHLNQ